ncbi:MAG: TonB-dependent receptor plug domain-containing protein [Prolixibacteraceae bacterium]|nr:TonB-dependent receptor plug domain-containing protein [Prolixibacteraceae bacterium]
MKPATIFLFIFSAIFFPFSSISQEHTIFGSVTTFEIIPVIKAEVYVKSSKQTVYTDSLGTFKVLCGLKDKIVVSAEGFYNQNLKVVETDDTLIVNLKLKPNDSELAINSGHIKDSAKLKSTLQLNDSKNDFSTYKDMYELLDNRFPNLQLVDSGFGDLSVIIGSPSSVNGSNFALIVIDGVISASENLGKIPPQEVKNIEILRPGGESSIYGSQGGNGVVRITTKRGGDIN